jgi:soluble lytic murein transglycosylase-like protein
MSNCRSVTFAAVAMLLLLVTAGLGCEDRTDPRAVFLDGWLDDRAPRLDARSRQRVVNALVGAEEETGTDAFLLVAVIEVESQYDPLARGPQGARGLMQLRPETARGIASRTGVAWSGPDDLHDPAGNVRLGAAYLAEMKEQFGDWKTALSAYHNGPTKIRRVQRRGRRVPSGYASRVLRRHREIRDAFDVTRR